MRDNNIELGLGLIGIGRDWGYVTTPVPDELQVLKFLTSAYQLNIRFYDTAPSYGKSEERLGLFLKTLTKEQRSKIIITTKFGEHWDKNRNCAYVDHSYDALCKSIDQSMALLGRIDMLQLHKTTPEVLKSDSLNDALDYAKSIGVSKFGASVSDMESGSYVCGNELYSFMQLPYNIHNTEFVRLIDLGINNNKKIITNRPFGMGKLLYDNESTGLKSHETEAFKFIINKNFQGVILTGTKDIMHLEQNVRAFEYAISLHHNSI